jgi:hypothetical protein
MERKQAVAEVVLLTRMVLGDGTYGGFGKGYGNGNGSRTGGGYGFVGDDPDRIWTWFDSDYSDNYDSYYSRVLGYNNDPQLKLKPTFHGLLDLERTYPTLSPRELLAHGRRGVLPREGSVSGAIALQNKSKSVLQNYKTPNV